jgi:hypothetical protein
VPATKLTAIPVLSRAEGSKGHHTYWVVELYPSPSVGQENICLKDATSTLMIMFKQVSGCICATRKTTDLLIRSQKILQYIER